MSSTLFELNQLRYFVAVAEELNFRRAARRLNITQPPLSRHINLLEHALDVRLFDRTNRSVRLTAAGERFLFDAIDILKRAESASLSARQTERGEGGALVLGFVPSATLEVIPAIVLRAARDMPDLTLTLREMMSFELIEGLLAGSLEIGLTRLPHRTPQLSLRKIWSEPFVLAVPRNQPLATKPDLTIHDLNGIDFIGYSTERGGFWYEVVQGYLNSVGVTPRMIFAVSQGRTIMALVDTGLGVGLVPRSNRHVAMANTVIRELALPETFRSDLYMALGAKEPAPLVTRFAALVATVLAE
ncbi:MAG: LysR substrate-binding domain-containing protein [Paracoccaceae bacterium]|nr:LysR substrate-binding domain-containing protein [Paracoccaceae bacterium]